MRVLEVDTLTISDGLLSEALHALFAFAPSALCVSTAGTPSRYLAVNPAYLQLTGLTWDQLQRQPLTGGGGAIESDARVRRIRLLEEVGFYTLEEVEIRHASGRVIPTLVSAQRRIIRGQTVNIEIIHDNSERKQAHRDFELALTAVAHTDYLTGLPNRAHFDELLAASLAGPLLTGLAYVDLNGFKAVNDLHGHAIGDALLRRIATRLSAQLRPGNIAARLGGDEFAVLFTCDPESLRHVAPRFRQLATEVLQPVRIDKRTLTTGAAIGIAVSSPGSDPETLLRAADRLMYQAKATQARIAICTSWEPEALISAA